MKFSPKYYALAAITIDGKIARYPGHFSNWTSKEDKKFLHEFLDTCDAIIVGHATYKLAAKPLSKRRCFVFTHHPPKINSLKKISFINPQQQNIEKIIKASGYKKICVLGGTQIYSYCLKNNLLDEIYLTIEPLTFGGGLSLFENAQIKKWQLKSIKKLNQRGSILLHYTK